VARQLVRIELSFVTAEDPKQLADRVHEAAASIVGREALEEFRVRATPLDVTRRDHLRSVDRT
jgi:hypothetical protein